MSDGLGVPASWEDITPGWLTDALARDFPGAVVADVTVQMRDDGTNRRARLAVGYEPGPAGPATVFVKAVDPDHKEMIKYTSGLLHEPRLFAAVKESGVRLPLEHPAVHAAPIDENAEEFMLVMEDLTARGADPR
ncbi:MAG: aminoglycoside phosphotransferase, partial [Mycobacterium sp.]